MKEENEAIKELKLLREWLDGRLIDKNAVRAYIKDRIKNLKEI